jgi:hypothetical protein
VFKVPGKLVDIETSLNPSARVSTLTAHGTEGDVTVDAAAVRQKLGLRSTWFRVGVLALDPLPAKAFPYGAVVTLSGLLRGLSDAKLEQRAVGTSAWAAAASAKARVDGSLALAVKAKAPAELRLAGGGIYTAPVTLRVQPVIRLKIPTAQTALGGTVQPAIPAAPVQIQRATAARWTTVATARTDDAGAFSASFAVTPGTYRARVAPGKGWAVAISPELRVVKT